MDVGDIVRYNGAGPWTTFTGGDLFLILDIDQFGYYEIVLQNASSQRLNISPSSFTSYFQPLTTSMAQLPNNSNSVTSLPTGYSIDSNSPILSQQLSLTDFNKNDTAVNIETKCDCGTHKTYGSNIDISFHSSYCSLMRKNNDKT